jgi:hypothetical protein
MAPVLVSKLKPAGNDGVMEKLFTVPETVADIVLIVVPTVRMLLEEA